MATLVLMLQSYNGLANDDEVFVVPLESFGTEDPRREAGACLPPQGDGTDVWRISDSVLVGDTNPLRTALKGYVVDSQLVVDTRAGLQPDNPSIQLPRAGPELSVRTPVLTGKLVNAGDGGFGLVDGVLTGRASTKATMSPVVTASDFHRASPLPSSGRSSGRMSS